MQLIRVTVFLRAALFVGAALLTGCAALVDDLVPDSGYRLLANATYASGPRHAVDVYLPDPAPTRPAPMVVFLYGGDWRDGDKEIYRFVGQAFASRGIVTVIPDYRTYPQVRFPGFLEDSAAAVAWARANAKSFGGDPNRLFLIGHSSGAYDAIMLAVDPRWLRRVGLDPVRDLRGVVGLAGPYDFLPFDGDTGPVFGAVPDPRTTQPVDLADGHSPPLLLIAGSADERVRPRNSQRLADVVVAHGGNARLRIYPGTSHRGLVGAIAAPLQWIAPTLTDCLAFIANPDRPALSSP